MVYKNKQKTRRNVNVLQKFNFVENKNCCRQIISCGKLFFFLCECVYIMTKTSWRVCTIVLYF